jgi:hypothetical protein
MTGRLCQAAAAVKADLYIAHYVAALPAAAKAAQRNRALYAFDAEDFHLGDTPDTPENQREKKIIGAIEGRYLREACYVTAASPMIADALAETYGIPRPHVLLNAFSRAQAPAGPTARGTAEMRPSIYWLSQTVGPDRGLECAVKAVGLSRARPHLFLRGLVSTQYQERLASLAEEVGVRNLLHFLAPAASRDMERLAAEHDLGLCGESDYTRARQRALTNKLFTFLLSGLPPLMSSTPRPGSMILFIPSTMRRRLVN